MENYENSSESSPVATTSRMVEMEASTSSTNVTLHERNCTPRPRCVYTAVNKPKINPSATPFAPAENAREREDSYPVIHVGPSMLPVNKQIWKAIAKEQPPPDLPYVQRNQNESISRAMMNPTIQLYQVPHQQIFPASPLFFNQSNVLNGFNHPPAFEVDRSRSLVFSRIFGPVANPDGTIEVRLHDGIRVLISLDHSILVLNPKSQVRAAISGDLKLSAMEHPNGKVYQQPDRVDIVAYDGTNRNTFVRFAKMWQKGVSLTSNGLALIYLVDNAGTRTTSDQVNREIRSSVDVFLQSSCTGPELYVHAAAAVNEYKYLKDNDNTEVFEIHGCQISQTRDGLVRVTRIYNQQHCLIRASPTNSSVALSIDNTIHCTASLGSSSHLFVRRDERRVHFDGIIFSVRNAGHSANFDDRNFLCVL